MTEINLRNYERHSKWHEMSKSALIRFDFEDEDDEADITPGSSAIDFSLVGCVIIFSRLTDIRMVV